MDMAVRVGELQAPNGLPVRWPRSAFNLCRASHRPAAKRIEHPAELLSLPTVVAKPSTVWRLTECNSNEHHDLLAAPQARLLVDDLATASDAVASGLGIGLLPLSLLAKHLAKRPDCAGTEPLAAQTQAHPPALPRAQPPAPPHPTAARLPARTAPQAANHYCQPPDEQEYE